MSAASAGRPDGPVGDGNGDDDRDISEPTTAPLPGPDENASPVAGEESCGKDEPSCEPDDDDEYEAL